MSDPETAPRSDSALRDGHYFTTIEGHRTPSAHVAAVRNYYYYVFRLAEAGLGYEEIEQKTGLPAATAQQWVASERARRQTPDGGRRDRDEQQRDRDTPDGTLVTEQPPT